MENSETFSVFTAHRHILQYGSGDYQSPYECGLRLTIPPTSMTGMTTTHPSPVDNALSGSSRNPTMSTPGQSFNPQQYATMSSESYRHPMQFPHMYEDLCQKGDPLFRQFSDVASSQSSHDSASAASWDFDDYSRQELDDIFNTPSLMESPTTTSSCPRTRLYPHKPDFSLWDSQPDGLPSREGNLNSPAPSYVLGSNSGPYSAHLRASKPPQLNYSPEKLKTSMSVSGSELLSTPSPTISHASMQPSYSMVGQYSPCEGLGQPDTDCVRLSKEDLDDDPNSAEPYAKLIHRALMSAPSYSMALKEIYEWFGKNTNKATDSSSKGWQNSIRHNLSMNHAFQKREIPSPGGTQSKRLNVWVLAPEAIAGGVKSTTRYRKQGANKKSSKSVACAPQRVNSGRKGGLAAKKAARRRKHAQDLSRRPAESILSVEQTTSHPSRSPITPLDLTPYQSTEKSWYTSRSPVQGHAELESADLNYDTVIGVADVGPEVPLFYSEDYDTNRHFADFPLFDAGNMDPFLHQ